MSTAVSTLSITLYLPMPSTVSITLSINLPLEGLMAAVGDVETNLQELRGLTLAETEQRIEVVHSYLVSINKRSSHSGDDNVRCALVTIMEICTQSHEDT